MNNKIKNAFDGIHAEERLKANTLSFLQNKINQIPQRNHHVRFRRLAVALACILALAVIGGISYNSYFTEAMYLDVDINPSIQLTINRFGRIIGVYAYNSDGQTLLTTLDLMHLPYGSAVTILTEVAIEEGFLSDGGLVSVTLQSGGSADDAAILETLQTKVTATARGCHALVQVDAFLIDGSTKEHAHDQNLSPAKYLAILELLEVDPTATVDGCRNHTIGEIRQLTEAQQDDDGSTMPTEDSTPHGNRHHGNGHCKRARALK